MAKYIRCSDAVHTQLKVRSAQTGKEMQDLADEAVQAYLANPLPSQQDAGIEHDTAARLLLELQKIDNNVLAILEKINLLLSHPASEQDHSHSERPSAGEKADRVIAEAEAFIEDATELIKHKKGTRKRKGRHPKIAGA